MSKNFYAGLDEIFHCRRVRIVDVQNYRAARVNCFDEFAFCLRDIFHWAQKFNVSFVDVGDDRDRRLYDFCERCNLSQAAHTDFNDGGFVSFAKFQQSHGNADFVIEVRRSFQNFAERTQNGGG